MWPALQKSNALIIDDESTYEDITFRLENAHDPIHVVYMSKNVEFEHVLDYIKLILTYPNHAKTIEYMIVKRRSASEEQCHEMNELFKQFPYGEENVEKFLGC